MREDMETRNYLLLYVNGVRKKITEHCLSLSLAEYLRLESQLTGTKVVCAEGDCGSCTVLMAKYDYQSHKLPSYQTINSCITLMHQLDCSSIITVEGLKDLNGLSEVQQKMAANHASQCGYCTPGFACSLSALIEDHKQITEQKIKNYCTGNLCRCTGYKAIIESALKIDPSKHISLVHRYSTNDIQEDFTQHALQTIEVSHQTFRFYEPISLSEALSKKQSEPSMVIHAGGTDLGVLRNKKNMKPQSVLSLKKIPSSREVQVSEEKLLIGSSVTLHEFEKVCAEYIPELEKSLRIFASPQIKHSATLIGNIANGSPIGDTMPALIALGSQLRIQSTNTSRIISLEKYYLGYKKFDLKQNEIITEVLIKIPKPNHVLKVYKQSKRKDLDISCISTALYFEKSDHKMVNVRVAFGGVAPIPLRVPELESLLSNKPFSQEPFQEASSEVFKLISPISDHRGSSDYRKALASQLILKCYHSIREDSCI